MIFLIRKRVITVFALSACISLLLSAAIWTHTEPDIQTFAASHRTDVTVIVDPGHGGEDGGAVSPDGVTESQLNLEIAQRVNDLLLFSGQHVIMTRTTDAAIHTEGNTIRARKASDIRNRVELVNTNNPAVLLSIHQNSLPSSPVTHGAQVFWNTQDGAEWLANSLQETLNTTINAGNEKQPKKISPTIYLMKHTAVPAVLIECGFLSNKAETELLQQPSYQTKLAAAITAGYLRALAGEEVS